MQNSPVQNCLKRETSDLVNHRKFSTVYTIRCLRSEAYLRTELFEQLKANSSRWRSSDRNIKKHHWVSTTQTSNHLLIHRLSTLKRFLNKHALLCSSMLKLRLCVPTSHVPHRLPLRLQLVQPIRVLQRVLVPQIGPLALRPLSEVPHLHNLR